MKEEKTKALSPKKERVATVGRPESIDQQPEEEESEHDESSYSDDYEDDYSSSSSPSPPASTPMAPLTPWLAPPKLDLKLSLSTPLRPSRPSTLPSPLIAPRATLASKANNHKNTVRSYSLGTSPLVNGRQMPTHSQSPSLISSVRTNSASSIPSAASYLSSNDSPLSALASISSSSPRLTAAIPAPSYLNGSNISLPSATLRSPPQKNKSLNQCMSKMSPQLSTRAVNGVAKVATTRQVKLEEPTANGSGIAKPRQNRFPPNAESLSAVKVVNEFGIDRAAALFIAVSQIPGLKQSVDAIISNPQLPQVQKVTALFACVFHACHVQLCLLCANCNSLTGRRGLSFVHGLCFDIDGPCRDKQVSIFICMYFVIDNFVIFSGILEICHAVNNVHIDRRCSPQRDGLSLRSHSWFFFSPAKGQEVQPSTISSVMAANTVTATVANVVSQPIVAIAESAKATIAPANVAYRIRVTEHPQSAPRVATTTAP